MDPALVQIRADICGDCPAPCEWRHSAAAHSSPAVACPSRRWPAWPEPAPGDALAATIEARVLAPLEQAVPAAAPLVRAARECGGCHHARHALGSKRPHRDPGVVL